MNHILIVTADTNDADYVTCETELDIKDSETMNLLNKVVEAIKGCPRHNNWPNSEYQSSDTYTLYKDILTEEEIEHFEEYCPYGEYGIHTIKSVRIVEVAGITNLL